MNEVYRDIEQHIPSLRRYAVFLTRNGGEADDLVQESVLRALSNAHLYETGTSLRAWLCTILRNQHISNVRRNVRAGIFVNSDMSQLAIATQPTQEINLTIKALDRALQRLPNHQRVLIELVALEGQSYKDIARSYGLAEGTVKSRIARGRSRLRCALKREDGLGGLAPQPWCASTNGAGQRASL